MKVHTRNPSCTVRIVSLAKGYGEIDAASVRASLRQVSVHRRMGQVAGAFQIVLLPRQQSIPGQSSGVLPSHWRDILGAMDYIEITFHVPPRLPQLVMRGFVDTVTDEFSISETPQRVVTINGRDYGKLLLITRIYYADEPEATSIALLKKWQEALAKMFSWKEKPSPPIADPMPRNAITTLPQFSPKDFVEGLLEAIYRPQEENILLAIPAAPKLVFHAVDEALKAAGDADLSTISPQLMTLNIQPFTDVWTILRIYQHHPWRELYIEEQAAGPRLVYRPTPWLDFQGSPVQASFDLYQDTLPHHRVTENEIVSTSLSHSDEEVRNFFFTFPDGFGAFAQMVKTIGPLEGLQVDPFRGNPYLSGYAEGDEDEDTGIMKRSNYKVAGFRILELRTPYLDFDRRISENQLKEQITVVRKQGARANEFIRRAFDHGAVLEFGAIQLKGNEQISVGHYLEMDSGPRLDLGQDARYYVEGISHVFRQGSSPSDGIFLTTCEVSRGRGHLIRKGIGTT